ncbi:MBL fold metallo-hydrolase [Lederbergia citrea]|uniref:MBL fold metallo-hydrolase n=1 Tax=Lederbergia citrea TaxID=2833581 RepID=UPI001BC99BC1|nr:MBL fold metallo-hydrolase [Lederbergia citrea]MBS4176348.1 MBL fold metallo-hydrolase [Lederbergia citrea]MBS4202909.1 MBL fold metallo-hydrolase [Lederbergia citrea]
MKWKQIPLGPLQTNCYLLYNEEGKCIIFDPGAEGASLNDFLIEQGFTPLAIVMTHAHFDHIGAIDAVRDQWDIPVYIHELEAEWLTNPSLNGSARYGANITAKAAEHQLSEEKKLSIGPFSLNLFHTPGHSPGSISYYSEEANVVFAGDTLFQGSIGRTDLPGGSHSQLLKSISEKLLILPEDTVVLSGHGPATTISSEKSNNPFLTGI